jgi:hypothetical protein
MGRNRTPERRSKLAGIENCHYTIRPGASHGTNLQRLNRAAGLSVCHPAVAIDASSQRTLIRDRKNEIRSELTEANAIRCLAGR